MKDENRLGSSGIPSHEVEILMAELPTAGTAGTTCASVAAQSCMICHAWSVYRRLQHEFAAYIVRNMSDVAVLAQDRRRQSTSEYALSISLMPCADRHDSQCSSGGENGVDQPEISYAAPAKDHSATRQH
jgi:hypothetical protein